ncbi:MAG: sensor domain-containing diguanylate cyclase [Planctomycetes bacterium]|nr:sensor domain-containing diguanylate cyclase [Planctomycetota bacterium]
MVLLAGPAADVLCVGRAEFPGTDEIEAAGLRVARAATFIEALERLARFGARVVVVHADALAGQDADRFAALRHAGARGVVAVYPPECAWRADRATSAGADAGVALPAAPGALSLAVVRVAAANIDPGDAADAARSPTGELAPSTVGALQLTAAEATSRSPWLEAVVADVSTMNRAIDDVERLLDLAIAAFQRRSNADRCSILLYDRERVDLSVRRTTAPRRDAADSGADTTLVPASGLAAHVARSGRPLLLSDVATAPPDVLPLLGDSVQRGYRTTSCLLLPLRGVEDVFGVACLADRRDGRPFRETDVHPLEFLADQAGQAIENGLAFRRLQELAAIDELTGLANRRQFQAALEREVQRARRYDRQVSLAILDLDHFKQFNDLCGHQAGDLALSMVGEILRTSLREMDIVARYGGEEFAVILPETAARPIGSARNPFPFLERLRRRIEEAQFPGEEKLPGGRLTVSGGVACYPDDAATVEELIREADRALYVSKSRGRNTISYRGKTFTD